MGVFAVACAAAGLQSQAIATGPPDVPSWRPPPAVSHAPGPPGGALAGAAPPADLGAANPVTIPAAAWGTAGNPAPVTVPVTAPVTAATGPWLREAACAVRAYAERLAPGGKAPQGDGACAAAPGLPAAAGPRAGVTPAPAPQANPGAVTGPVTGSDAGVDGEGGAPAPGAPHAAAGLPLGVAQRVQAQSAAYALSAYAERLAHAEQARITAAGTWGLRQVPLRPPPPPAPEEKPGLVAEPGQLAAPGLPPVLTRVPTDDPVVFLTIDDGAEKDPELLRMLDELDVPATGFLSDYLAREDYDYFRQAHDQGVDLHNHTLNHNEMPRLSYEEQEREICGQQDRLAAEIGERPELFRPPYGAYNYDTLRAAAACGIEAVPLWAEEAFPDRIEWRRADQRFHPGDIILTHFRGEEHWDGTMTDVLRRVIDEVTRQGFALARLDDYL